MNYKTFHWTAPTKNTDGTDITYPLDYAFWANEVGDEPAEILTTPGVLNADGKYEAPIASMPFFVPGKTYEVRLQTVDHRNPANRSIQSNKVTFTLSNEVPEVPLDFSVE